MPDIHSNLPPSSAHRWLVCTLSPQMEEPFPSTTSEAAEQGTAAHSMAEMKVKAMLGEVVAREPTEFDDDEMEDLTDNYRTFILEQIQEAKKITDDPLIMVEQKLSFEDIIPGGFGTADLIIATPKKLWITDLKYGKGVPVYVSKGLNPQLCIYAYGAYSNFRFLFPDVESVIMTIYQPRISNIDSFEISIKELVEWAETYVKPRAIEAAGPGGVLVPGDHCKFCRAKAVCKARAEEALKLAQERFTTVTGSYATSQGEMPMYTFKSPATLSQDEIEDVLPILNRVQDWITAVFTYVADEAISHGRQWKGYKVVEGRATRKYVSEKMVEEACKKAGYTNIYEQSLLPLTKLEKKLSKPVFKELLEDKGLVVKAKGKLTLTEESDPREAVDPDKLTEETGETKLMPEDVFRPITG